MDIIEIVRKYNAFQNEFGQNNLKEFEINSLFTENFKKIANGQTLVEKSSNLLSQLTEIKNSAGSWNIEEIEIQPFSNDEKRCLNHYNLNSEKLGSFDVMSIVTVDEDNLITHINEIYYLMGQ